jgi:hypothetical protein
MWSGNPVPQITNGNTNGSRRGTRVNQVGDPFSNLPSRHVPGGVYWFNPFAFRARRRHVRHDEPRAVPAAGRPPVGYHAVEELVSGQDDAVAVPGGLDQRVQPHAVHDARRELRAGG